MRWAVCVAGMKEKRNIYIYIYDIDGKARKKENIRNKVTYVGVITMINSRRMRWAGYVARRERRGINDIGGKARRIETTRKTNT
jgi:hypothetical protein